MIVVGDFISQVGNLCLDGRLGAGDEALAQFAQAARMVGFAMLEYAFARLEAKIEPVKGEVAVLQPVDNTQALQIVLEPAGIGRPLLHAGVQFVLAGMPKRRMSQVMGQGNGLDQIFIDLQHTRHGTGDLGHLKTVCEAGAEQIAFVVDEHLSLVFQQPECLAMHDAVTIALKLRTLCRWRLLNASPPRLLRKTRIRGQPGCGNHDAGSETPAEACNTVATSDQAAACTDAEPSSFNRTKRMSPPCAFLSVRMRACH